MGHSAYLTTQGLIYDFLGNPYPSLLTKQPDGSQVHHAGIEHQRNIGWWSLVQTLLQGQDAVKAEGEKLLPRQRNKDGRFTESEEQFRQKLALAVYVNKIADTRRKLASKPFSRPLTMVGDLPPELQRRGPVPGFDENADFAGRSMHRYAKEVFGSMLEYGWTYVFVDYGNIGGGSRYRTDLTDLNVEQEEQLGLRPYCITIDPDQMLSILRGRTEQGIEVCVYARWKELRIERSAEFAEREVEYIREWFAPMTIVETLENGETRTEEQEGRWRLWRRDPDDGEFQMVDEAAHDFPGIPLVKIEFDEDENNSPTPLKDFSGLQLAHYQSYADQRNLLRFNRSGVFYFFGKMNQPPEGEDEGAPKVFVMGANAAVFSPGEDSKIGFAEPEGKGLDQGWRDKEDLEQQMEQIGAQAVMRPQVAGETATGRRIDEGDRRSVLSQAALNLEIGLLEITRVAMLWYTNSRLNVDTQLAEDFAWQVFKDFDQEANAAQVQQSLETMRERRDLSQETYLERKKADGTLPESLDVEEEIARTEAEQGVAPVLGPVPGEPAPAEDPDAMAE